MADDLTARDDMAEAEGAIRRILADNQPGEAMSALLSFYQGLPDGKRDAFVAVMAARVAIAERPRIAVPVTISPQQAEELGRLWDAGASDANRQPGYFLE